MKLEKNIMFVCAENPKTSHCVTVLMRAQALDQEFSQLPKQDSSHFADASTAKMKQESVTELTAHYRVGLIEFSFFSLANPILVVPHHRLS